MIISGYVEFIAFLCYLFWLFSLFYGLYCVAKEYLYTEDFIVEQLKWGVFTIPLIGRVLHWW